MISTILLKSRLVVDPLLWQILLGILGAVVALGVLYLVRIHIAWRMAKDRHRDPLGWVLLSLFVSPVLAWIILLIVGDSQNSTRI